MPRPRVNIKIINCKILKKSKTPLRYNDSKTPRRSFKRSKKNCHQKENIHKKSVTPIKKFNRKHVKAELARLVGKYG